MQKTIKTNIDQLMKDLQIVKIQKDIKKLGMEIQKDSWKRFWIGAVWATAVCSLFWFIIYLFFFY